MQGKLKKILTASREALIHDKYIRKSIIESYCRYMD